MFTQILSRTHVFTQLISQNHVFILNYLKISKAGKLRLRWKRSANGKLDFSSVHLDNRHSRSINIKRRYSFLVNKYKDNKKKPVLVNKFKKILPDRHFLVNKYKQKKKCLVKKYKKILP